MRLEPNTAAVYAFHMFNQQIADKVCELMIEGNSVRQICRLPEMPNRSTILRWLDENEAFAAKCARARLLMADHMDDLIMEEAELCDSDNFQAAKVRISAYQWRAAKLNPKKYGEKLGLDHSGSVAVTLVTDIPRPPK